MLQMPFLHHFITQSCGMSLWILEEVIDFTSKEQSDTIKYDILMKGSLPGRQTLHDKPLGHRVRPLSQLHETPLFTCWERQFVILREIPDSKDPWLHFYATHRGTLSLFPHGS